MTFENQPIQMSDATIRWFTGLIVQVDGKLFIPRTCKVENTHGHVRLLLEYSDKICNAMTKAIIARAPYFENTDVHKFEGRILI